MHLDILNEIQAAFRPTTKAAERQLLRDTLAQAELADRMGYGCWWSVEHHGAGDFSLSSTPELFNLAVAERTERIRIGHSGVLSPFGVNHPIRVAERAAFLDVMSGGRLEMGLARSAGSEWENFGIDGSVTRPQLRELFAMLPRMWAEPTFSWQSDLITVPPIDVIPKPLQEPHPPLWQTCTSPDAFKMAGELGVGVLCNTLLTPLESLGELRDLYKSEIARCTPAGDFVNDRLAVFTFVHCARSRQEAIANRAGEAVLWYVNHVAYVFRVPRENVMGMIRGALLATDAKLNLDPGGDDSPVDPDDPLPVIRLLNRQFLGMPLDPEEVWEVLEPLDCVIVGDPEDCHKKMSKFAELGVDRLLCFQQFGALDTDDVTRSIRMVGQEILPALAT
jgi:alkanesulfonate monooxygenase SsuD/methylene tetrahydromethanopterin reductase-like flavin-dependent oxidoreductase (luciferase family)